MTECNPQADLFSIGRRVVRAVFQDRSLSSDAGALLLRKVDRKYRIIDRMAGAIADPRDPAKVRHSVGDLLRQRVFQIACGYEDAADANALRHDHAFQAALGRVPGEGSELASQPTLSRFEQRRNRDLMAMSRMLGELWIERLRAKARRTKKRLRITIDFDSTDLITYGDQQLALFHGHYGHYIYYPLLAFDQDGWPVAVVLRGGRTRAGGVASVLLRIYKLLVESGLRFDLSIRADAGFSFPEVYELCETMGIDYVIGLITHPKLKQRLEPAMEEAREIAAREGKARILTDFMMRWGRKTTHERRIIGKAEVTSLGDNPRFLITNMKAPVQKVYEFYTGRGRCENHIKELKNALCGDRMSCHRFAANQFRLLEHTTAYILMMLLREHLAGTELARAQMDTIRLRLLKMGAVIRVTARHIWIEMSSAHPSAWLWPLVNHRLSTAPG